MSSTSIRSNAHPSLRRSTSRLLRTGTLVAAGAILMSLAMGGIESDGSGFGLDRPASAAIVQDGDRPARPATPPTRRVTPPEEDDLPEGLRVRPVPPLRPVTGGAGIHFEKLDHQFGQMTNAETRNTTFTFINTGDEPLLLQDVVAGCACTRPSFERREYAPGERGTISVAFTPPTGGHQAKAMSVVTNAVPPNDLVRIRVIGDVEAVLSFEPKVHDIGEIEIGKVYETSFTLVADAETTYFDRVTARGAGRGAPQPGAMQVTMVGDGPQQGKAELAVLFPNDLPWGRITTGAVIVSTRGTTGEQTITKNLPLRVTGVVVDDIRADEYVIQLGNVEPGGSFEGEARIYHKDGKPIELIGVRVDAMDASMRGVADAVYRVEVRPSTDPEKPGQIIRLSGNPRSHTGFLSGNVKFRVLVDGEIVGEEREVGLNGRVAHPDRVPAVAPASR